MTAVRDRPPFARGPDGVVELENVVFADSPGVFSLTLRDGRIEALTAGSGEGEWLCLPPLTDLHVHANRAFTPPAVHPVGLEDAARNVREVLESFTEDDFYRQSRLLIEAARRRATTRLRTHADLGPEMGLDAVVGSLRAAAEYSGRVDVEVVAFSGGASDPATDRGRAMLREAIGAGARFLGAVPAFCEDQRATIDAVLDLAVELGVPVDLHLDEHLDPDRSRTGYLAAATIERGLQGQVTVGHACAIGRLPDEERANVIGLLAEAEITIVALPRTNLFLQDSGSHSPVLRGVAPVKEMLSAGVEVRFASDNVRDAFYPYGDADLLGVAMDGVLATHVYDPAAIVSAICCGRSSVVEGDPADMVLLPAASLDAALADSPVERWVFRSGRPELV